MNGVTAAEKVCGVALRPVEAGDFALLCELKSPVVELARSRVRPRFTEEQSAELCFLFTIPQVQARLELELGREHFQDCAVALLDKLSVHQTLEIGAAVARRFATAIRTFPNEVKAMIGGVQ
jgi:hypothetical protein